MNIDDMAQGKIERPLDYEEPEDDDEHAIEWEGIAKDINDALDRYDSHSPLFVKYLLRTARIALEDAAALRREQ